MSTNYDNKTILITGGTGSFGKTVTKKLLDTDVKEIRIFSRDEAKQDAMRHELEDSRLRFYVGDIRDYTSIERATRDVDYVFHAAALKQVPSCEFFPMEAVKTNIIGSDNVIRACEDNEVKSLVCLSTDKAAYPINAMGISKAMMEKVARSHGMNNPNAKTIVSITRYGNVMYSRGSVIPLFIQQIKDGKPLTITNPDMTRFMMSLDQSVELVEYAFKHARQGDLFIRKAPSATVKDLAVALCELFEVEPNIKIIGTRHAEKVSEALATGQELATAEDMGDYYRVVADNRDLNYSTFFEEGKEEVKEFEDYDSHTSDRLDVEGVKELLLTLPKIRKDLEEAGITKYSKKDSE
ncbi:MAG: polysaccharide biosynthesis protein [Micrococcaceae bacterium]